MFSPAYCGAAILLVPPIVGNEIRESQINVAATALYGSDPEQIAGKGHKLAVAKIQWWDCVLLWNEIATKFVSTALNSTQQKPDWQRLFLDPLIPQGLVPIALRPGVAVPGVTSIL